MSANRSARLLLMLGAVSMLAGLTACGGGIAGNDSKDAVSPVSRDAGGDLGSVAAPEPALDAGAAENESVASSAITRSVIATASVSLHARKPDDVRRRALAVVAGLGGTVDKEQATSDRHGRVEEVFLTLRVPSDSFEKALDELAGLGTLEHREQSAKDVTTQVIDLDAKVRAQRAAVASFERLLTRATKIGEIVSIENQLTARQGELDSLVQQQRYLADQTAMSTVELTVERTPRRHRNDAGGGFLGGLDDGWRALGRTVAALGVVLGAVLPFAVVLALLGVPVALSVRRLRARGRSAA